MTSIRPFVLSICLLLASSAYAEQRVVPVRGELTAAALVPVTKLLESGWRVVLVSTGGYAWAWGDGYRGDEHQVYLHTIFILESPPAVPAATTDARASALSKLTSAERQALGLKD